MRINILAATIITCYLLPITCILFFYLKNGFSAFSIPMVVGAPCPGYTTVSLGSTNKRLQI